VWRVHRLWQICRHRRPLLRWVGLFSRT
jgi:hypothetical protein